MILGWAEKQVRWLAAIALGGIVFALGPNGLLNGVLYSLVPGMDKARVPGAGIVLFSFALAPLAAYGLDYIAKPAAELWSRRATWVLAAFGCFVAGLGFLLTALKIDSGLGDDRIMITALGFRAGRGLLAAVAQRRHHRKVFGVAVLGLVLLELSNVTDYGLPNRSDKGTTPMLAALSQDSDLVDYIRSRGTAARVEYDDQLVPYNIGDWYGVEAVNAYTAGVLTKIYEMDVFSHRGMNFFGIRFFLGKTPPHPGLVAVFTGRSGLKVFENPDALPRIWSVHAAASLPDRTPHSQHRCATRLSIHAARPCSPDPAPEGIGGCSSGVTTTCRCRCTKPTTSRSAPGCSAAAS